ncbi:hypothetical protein CAAN1_05S06216 [[Candida] anglica]|uniref:Enoyl reductase (ER) domain-containing protein n=1 Tax=[Candida] anglica TaxID=148631 RepID=A0ABP0EEK0_9ASCO
MSNTVASFSGDTGYNLTSISKVEIPTVPKDALLIKGIAYAANPTDWKHLVYGLGPKGSRLGTDVAGVVEEVGSEVKGFEKGDIVSHFMHGNTNPDNGAFQEYLIANPATTIKYNKSGFKTEALPSGQTTPIGKIDTFEGAASVTLGLVTIGLSFSHHLKISSNKADNADKYILIWGGATATGFLAIQVAKLVYGLKVIATASKKHHECLKNIGADYLVDYNDKDAVDQIRAIGGSKINYGFDAVSNKDTFQSLYDATSETKDVRLDNLLFLSEKDINADPNRKVYIGETLAYVVTGENVNFGGHMVYSSPELIAAYTNFWTEILPPYIPQLVHSNLKVLTPGFESIDVAFSLLRENKVSGEKLVFRRE